ncbi:hypothetical protein EDC94DRAFT_485210, partial [Helicostylum pulchrum]
IISNHAPEGERVRLVDEFNSWRKTLSCSEFWKEQNRLEALSEVDVNCSRVVNNFLVKNSEQVLTS